MHIVLVGLNHRSAPIEVRERLAFRKEQLPEAFGRLRGDVGLREVAILSTCNRVEIYAGVPELDGTMQKLHGFLSEHAKVALAGLSPRLYSYTEPESVRHLFTVASGLDSMVLGEAEILHQVKYAYEWAREEGATSKLFNGLFQRALNTAKAVRTQTTIGWGSMSIGTVAVELAEKIFGRLSGTVVLLIGAGKVGELTLKRLTDHGVRDVRIMNRSLERAVDLASSYRALPLTLEQLPEQLAQADIVISSASVPAYLLDRDEVRGAMRSRHHRSLCVIDLGVPRNIDPGVGQLENVYLFDIDDLEQLVSHAHSARQQAVRESQDIIDRKVERFLAWWRTECGMRNAECGIAGQESVSVVLRSSCDPRHSIP